MRAQALSDATDGLLGPREIREIAARLELRPTKTLGQNFVVDANTVRRIVRLAQVDAADVVLEVGPGLGSLTLGLAGVADRVIAVEVDPVLARALPDTIARQRPDKSDSVTVIEADALRLTELPDPQPTTLVANLPYNIAVPVLLHILATFPTVRSALVMVQLEVASRLAAEPGSKVYGIPSVKARWYGEVRSVGRVGPQVFWPVPRVDSGLVSLVRARPRDTAVSRAEVFAVIDAAFSQRRKTLRAALARWAGSAQESAAVLAEAGIESWLRGESLTVEDYVRIAEVHASRTRPPSDSQ
jgi:16S rRNA (adenine1518-N6/adenine1519-N6)-dimethyltransferase